LLQTITVHGWNEQLLPARTIRSRFAEVAQIGLSHVSAVLLAMLLPLAVTFSAHGMHYWRQSDAFATPFVLVAHTGV
jgi:hypothetical protein